MYRKFQTVASALFALTVAGTVAEAKPKILAYPLAYDPAGSGIARGEYRNYRNRFAIYLAKLGPTNVEAAGVVEFPNFPPGQNFTSFDFDVADGSYCNPAPRLNLRLNDGGPLHFFGCIYGTKSASTTPGWTHIHFDANTPYADMPAGNIPIKRLEIIMDEGTDNTGAGTPGQTYLSNFFVNGIAVRLIPAPSHTD